MIYTLVYQHANKKQESGSGIIKVQMGIFDKFLSDVTRDLSQAGNTLGSAMSAKDKLVESIDKLEEKVTQLTGSAEEKLTKTDKSEPEKEV